MDYTIPIPIKKHDDYDNDYDCICKYCNNPQKYITKWDGYSYLWNKCLICDKKVWYWHQNCSLYGKRSPYLVCFYCRIPFYEKGMKNGEIYTTTKHKQNRCI